MAEEICQSIRYNIVIRIVGRLGEFHFAFQILKSLKEISFLTIGGTLFGLGQLCISFIMQRAYPITNDGISSSIETTFYRYVGYATINWVALKHGNVGSIKPQAHTLHAIATLMCIINKSTDHMRHRSRILAFGEKVVSKVFLVTWKWKESIPELNTVNSAFGLKEVSLSNLSKIPKLNFLEYATKKLGDNFACCSPCERLHFFQKAAILGSQNWEF